MTHDVAVKLEKAIDVINGMDLITKETFDSFLLSIISWYREEVRQPNHIPNLFDIFYFQEPYTHMVYEIFAQSLAWRDTYASNQENSDDKEFSEDEITYYVNLLADNIDKLQPLMIRDSFRLLECLNLFYVWDTREYGGDDRKMENNPICEVW